MVNEILSGCAVRAAIQVQVQVQDRMKGTIKNHEELMMPELPEFPGPAEPDLPVPLPELEAKMAKQFYDWLLLLSLEDFRTIAVLLGRVMQAHSGEAVEMPEKPRIQLIT